MQKSKKIELPMKRKINQIQPTTSQRFELANKDLKIRARIKVRQKRHKILEDTEAQACASADETKRSQRSKIISNHNNNKIKPTKKIA